MFSRFENVVSEKSYEIYRKNRKEPVKTIVNYVAYKNLANAIFNLLSKKMVEEEDGCCIKDLGYFCHLIRPNKILNMKTDSIVQRYKKRHNYIAHYIPDFNLPQDWSMDYAFISTIRLNKNKLDIEYKYFPNVCEGIISLEDSTKSYLNAKKRGDKDKYIYERKNRH